MSGVHPSTSLQLTLPAGDVQGLLQLLGAQRVDSGFAALYHEIQRQAEAQTTPPPEA